MSLTIKERGRDLPFLLFGLEGINPCPEVSGESIEVEVQTIAGKSRDAPRCQSVGQRMNESVSASLRPRTEVSSGDEFRFSIERGARARFRDLCDGGKCVAHLVERVANANHGGIVDEDARSAYLRESTRW